MKTKLLTLISLIAAAASGHGQNTLVSGAPSVPNVSAAVEASHVIRATPNGALANLVVTDTASEYIMIINAAAVPSDGALTNLMCAPIKVTANVTTMISFPAPLKGTAGIVVCNSSTGTLTKTAGANTCIFSWQLQ